MQTFSPRRAALIFGAIAVTLSGMTARVAYLQTYGRQRSIHSAERQQHSTQPIWARRGSIFDRNGILMAGTIQTQTLYVDAKVMLDQYQKAPRNLTKMDQDRRKVSKLIETTPYDLPEALAQNPDSRYLKLAENLNEKMAAEILAMKVPGVAFEAVPVRYYPMGATA